MNKFAKISLAASLAIAGLTSSALGADTLAQAFSNGTLKGQIKTYYFAQDFDGAGKNDSSIWVNGGNLNYVTDSFYGIKLGATFQSSHVGSIDDEDGKTAGSMDASGEVLSETYIDYQLQNTNFKAGRQYVKTPLVAGSGSRMIKEAFEAYFLTNTDIPNTTISLGQINKYQTRTDKTSYSDSTFVDYNAAAGTGKPGNFNDIGENGIRSIYVKNTSIPNLDVQAQYNDIPKELAALYADAKYKFGGEFNPFVAAQYYDTSYDDSSKKDNSLYGIRAGLSVADINLFAGYTSADGSDGDDRVYRGLGQGAYYHYTATTKTAGNNAFIAGTDAWQIGVAKKFGKLATKLRYTSFDSPALNSDLDETTLNLGYKFTKQLSASVDFSWLDYEDSTKDQTDLRSRLIYSF